MQNEIVLRFRNNGPGYVRAKEVATFMGVDIENYLLECIKHGHRVLKSDMAADLELPACLPRGPVDD